MAAIRQAMERAGWDRLRDDDAIFLATTTGLLPVWEGDFLGAGGDLVANFRSEPLGASLRALRSELAFRGHAQVITSACAASTHALVLASRWLKTGRAKRCLVGGVEILSRLTVEGFKSLQLLSSETATPFDIGRKGINLSEGAAFLCLERESGDSPLGKITGGAITNDAHHMTAPHPEGRGSETAIRRALDEAGLRPSDIDWVHAHGTGSPHNDLAEGAALHAIFGDGVPVSSTKAIHGHALAASGALETIVCLEAIRSETIPKTFGMVTPDPRIRLRHGGDRAPRRVVKNTLGFGGTNGAIVLEAAT